MYFYQVRSLDKEKTSESRIQIQDLVGHLQGKLLSSRPEPTDSSMLPGNKAPGQQINYQSGSTFVPERKVSFNTQKKMTPNSKKRYEGVMTSMSRLEPTDSSMLPGNKAPGQQINYQSGSTFVPEMKVSFNTPKKMTSKSKKRYEGSMTSMMKSLLARIGSKNAVHVIGVCNV